MAIETKAEACFHGGAIYDWVGDDFARAHHIDEIIDADVLDAWFEPSPVALQALSTRLSWSLRCSPPAAPTGVERAIADSLCLSADHIVCGAGSSALIFLALREILTAQSRVLILDPTYGEYAHVLNNVIGCRCDRFALNRDQDFRVDLARMVEIVNGEKFDLLILVNPNNPSGQLIKRDALCQALDQLPQETMIWIDEAYIDYAGREQSLSTYAASKPNVIVCKSLSKVLALSGLRVAYLCSNERLAARFKRLTPPWSLSLPAQVVLIEALKDRRYYDWCYQQTHSMRHDLSRSLEEIGFTPLDSVANFMLVDYDSSLPAAQHLISSCRKRRLLIRDVRSMGNSTGANCFRIAVKQDAVNKRMAQVLREALDEISQGLVFLK